MSCIVTLRQVGSASYPYLEVAHWISGNITQPWERKWRLDWSHLLYFQANERFHRLRVIMDANYIVVGVCFSLFPQVWLTVRVPGSLCVGRNFICVRLHSPLYLVIARTDWNQDPLCWRSELSKSLAFKAWGGSVYIALRVSLTARKYDFLISAFPFHSTSFFCFFPSPEFPSTLTFALPLTSLYDVRRKRFTDDYLIPTHKVMF